MRKVEFHSSLFEEHVSVLAVGTIAFDDIETPFKSARNVLGGTATYATLAARLAGAPVRLVAVVGNDFPDRFIELLLDRGVDLAGLQVDASGKTFAWGGRYAEDPNHRTTLFTDLNVLATFDPTLPPSYQDSRIVCLGNLDPSIQLRVLDQVPKPVLSVCDTMNYWITNTPGPLRTVLQRVDCLVLNDEEARQMTGLHNLAHAAESIRAQGPRIVVVKKGEHGAFLFTGKSMFITPAFPTRQVQDPTGAGDAFLGGFCGHLACEALIDDAALQRAVLYGTVMASFVVERLGIARLLDLTSEEIARRIAALRRAVAWPENTFVAEC